MVAVFADVFEVDFITCDFYYIAQQGFIKNIVVREVSTLSEHHCALGRCLVKQYGETHSELCSCHI